MGNVSTHAYFELKFTELNVARLQWAINTLIQRHPALRTVFYEGEQQILTQAPEYRIVDHGVLNEMEGLSLRERLSHKIYDPSRFPLFDFEVSQQQGKAILHIGKDALIMDGNSFALFFAELTILYNAPDPKDVKLPELTVNFRDYMLRYVQIRESKLFEQAKNYWIKNI